MGHLILRKRFRFAVKKYVMYDQRNSKPLSFSYKKIVESTTLPILRISQFSNKLSSLLEGKNDK